jgi:hypothetical protein
MSARTLAAIVISFMLSAASVMIGSSANAQSLRGGRDGRGGWDWYGPSHMII